ncbi:MAG: Rpn family recombination-promoting nuclease/putative transposase [Rickettsiales bacterium]|jgi:predicted transposase/invertase (TIGR01784 family)|nr:Rpn family recombination-promoting nuclease/putative transposase [Rickettsiales bacterium]
MEPKEGSEKLLRVTADFVFKHIFGSEKHERILVSLLNSILQGEPEIEAVEIYNSDVPRSRENGKDIRLDILARTSRGTIINIEIQCRNCDDIINRAIFYQNRLMPQELEAGQNYNDIADIISIWITDFIVFSDRKHYLNEITDVVVANDIDPMKVGTKKFRILMLELKKITYTIGNIKMEHMDMLRLWMTFIKHPETIPEDIINQVPEIGEAMAELKKISGDKNFRIQYDAYLMAKNDRIADETTATRRGMEKGIEKGLKRGEEGKAKKIALSMLKKGLSQNIVVECTGLSEEEVLKLGTKYLK